MDKIERIVRKIVQEYWVGYNPHIIENYIQRHIFEVGLVARALEEPKGKSVIDVGGGWGAFTAACAALGMKATLMDDFGDGGMGNQDDPRQSLATNFAVSVVSRDVVARGLGLSAESFDAVTSFDMIEHLHASPRDFLQEAVKALRQNGVFLLGAPNCVNLRKRIMVPLGVGQWSDFSDWYQAKVFRGHGSGLEVRTVQLE
jgi:2-polyprenyl-3-methyl-5-hydroxy-6-metoxy-1,4-benzoquinol methylase